MKKNIIDLVLYLVGIIGIYSLTCKTQTSQTTESNSTIQKDSFVLTVDTSCEKYKKLVLKVDCEKAKEIAKKEGYWQISDSFYAPKLRLVDSLGTYSWHIQSYVISYTMEGKCKYTNGCKIIDIFEIKIDGISGNVFQKNKFRKTIAIYE